MRHTSGLTYGFFGEGMVKKAYVDAKLFEGDFDNAEFAERIAKLPLAYQPGTTWDYSHSTDILGRRGRSGFGQIALSVREGTAARSARHEGHQLLRDGPAKKSLIAEPFPNDRTIGNGCRDERSARRAKWESGGGGMVSTIGDYARFMRR